MIKQKVDERAAAVALAGVLALASAPPVSAATVPVANGGGNLYLSVTTTGSGSSAFGNISAVGGRRSAHRWPHSRLANR